MKIKIIVFLVVLIIILFGYIFRSYKNDIKQVYRNIETLNSNILETSFGKLEYLCQGEGIPVLVVHGIAGGCDQALQTGVGIFGEKFKILGVSRFGYLKSSLPEESTPKNQVKAYKELLDNLGIEKTIVLGTSAGGAPAIKFALEYPERTRALILVGSGAPTKEEIKGPTGPPHFILNDFTFWLMSKPMKSVMLSAMFGIDKETYNNASLDERENVDVLLKSLLPTEPRKSGIINDEKITNPDMIINFNEYNLEKISIPTLIIHAQNDPLASYENAKKMSKRIPEAKFVEFENGGHLVFGHGKEIQKIINEFLKIH